MSDEKIIKVRIPSFTRLFIGGLAAYWLSTIMNPAFVAIGFLVILMIPVLTVDNMFSRQFSTAYKKPPEPVKPKSQPKAVEETKDDKTKVVKTAIEQKLEKSESKKEKHHKAKHH